MRSHVLMAGSFFAGQNDSIQIYMEEYHSFQIIDLTFFILKLLITGERTAVAGMKIFHSAKQTPC